MDKLRVVLCIFSWLLINPVYSEIYAGGGLGHGELDVDGRYDIIDGRENHIQGIVGYSWPFFDLEVGYLAMKEISGYIPMGKRGLHGSVDVDGMVARGIFKVPLNDHFKLLLSFGGNNLNFEKTQTTTLYLGDEILSVWKTSKTERKWNRALGMGVQFMDRERMRWRVRWERIFGDNFKLDLYGVEILFSL